jgi:periplasmic protein TonB
MPTPQQTSDNTGSLPPSVAYERAHRRRMLVALAVLLVALALVIVKDIRSLPAETNSDSEPADLTPHVMAAAPTVSPKPATAVAAPKVDVPENSVTKPQKRQTPPASSRAKSKKQVQVPRPAEPEVETDPDNPSIVATNRAVLPPLEVEVVAGDQHRPLQPSNPGVKVEMQSANAVTSPTPASSSPGSTTGAARVQLSPGTVEVVSRPVEPTYPLLAKQMKVQGAVVLEALIGKEGEIQDIQVLSGPAILSAAAREAVKQWRFKPYLQSGRAMETEARITVNFTISTY